MFVNQDFTSRNCISPQHNKQDDLWIIIDAKVYDLTRFVGMHPGGIAALTDEEVGA